MSLITLPVCAGAFLDQTSWIESLKLNGIVARSITFAFGNNNKGEVAISVSCKVALFWKRFSVCWDRHYFHPSSCHGGCASLQRAETPIIPLMAA